MFCSLSFAQSGNSIEKRYQKRDQIALQEAQGFRKLLGLSDEQTLRWQNLEDQFWVKLYTESQTSKFNKDASFSADIAKWKKQEIRKILSQEQMKIYESHQAKLAERGQAITKARQEKAKISSGGK